MGKRTESTGPRRWVSRLRTAWLRALLLSVLLTGFLAPVGAQMTDDASTSTTGTQFVRPDPPEAPKPPAPPQVPPPAAITPPPVRPTPQGPPSRYPEVLLLLDTSDSMMNEAYPGGPNRLDEARGALRQVLSGMGDQTRVQLWVFNTKLFPLRIAGQPVGSFTPVGQGRNRQHLTGLLDTIRTAGGTNLYQAVTQALTLFQDPQALPLYQNGERFPVLVVISDGEDGGKTRETLETVQAAKRANPLVTVNTIGFRVGKEDPWFRTLCSMATRPEGCAAAGDGKQLHSMLEAFHRPPRP